MQDKILILNHKAMALLNGGIGTGNPSPAGPEEPPTVPPPLVSMIGPYIEPGG